MDITNHELAGRRRDVLRTIGLSGAAAAAGSSILAGCGSGMAPGDARPGATAAPAGQLETRALRIGYLPITDATPLLLAHAQGLYAAEGLEASRPTLFRGWSQLAEAFQARQVDVVHILMPTAVWMRFGQNFPVKLVAWNHTDGSALTVANTVKSLDDVAGRRWASRSGTPSTTSSCSSCYARRDSGP